jgi:CUB domain/Secretion system C-terminal sorting domain/Divergent InlB B-repeat domain
LLLIKARAQRGRRLAIQNRTLVAIFGRENLNDNTTLTQCSGSFDDGSGATNYAPNLLRSWDITPASGYIALWFSELDITAQDEITIYEGNSNSRILARYSGNSPFGDTIFARGEYVSVVFRTRASGKGWRLNYKCDLRPRYTVNLATNAALDGSPLSGAVLGGGVFLQGDTATIIALPNLGSEFTKLWRILPQSVPGAIDTFATKDTVRFVVNKNYNLYAYFKQTPTCSGLKTITANDTTIEDGSGRLPYTPNLNCGWLIKPRSNPRSIAIKLTDVHFGVFNSAGPGTIKIYDGESAAAPLLLTSSGEKSEDSTVANSGKAFVTFTSIASDGSSSYYVGNGGWQLQYRSDTTKIYLISNVEPSDGSVVGSGTYTSNKVVTLTAKPYYPNGFINWTDANTGEILSTEAVWKFIPTKNLRVRANFSIGGICTNVNRFTDCNKTFEDGSGDTGYKSNLDCAWLIQPASATSNGVLLYFNFMSVNKTDTVSIYDGTSVNGRLLGRFNGDTIPPRVIAKSGSMYIRFKTVNQTVTKLGWDATYSCDTVRRYTVYVGINDTLKGLVTGAGRYTEGSEVVLVARTKSRFYRFRGFNYPSQSSIQQDTLRFKITSDVVVYANFTEMQCGGVARFVHPDYTIEDGSYSNNYEDELDCAWLIQPPFAKRIDLRFNSFFLQNCCDSVNIYDGINAKGRLLGRFNGSNLPPKDSLVAYSGSMFITFKTDGSGTDQGWSLKYKTFYDPIPPANDNCYRAAGFPLGVLTDGTTVNATLSSNPNLALPCEPSQNIKDVWYKFRSDTGAQRAFYIRVSFDISQSLLPLKYAFYKDNCSNLERISGCKQIFPRPEIQRDTFYLLDANQDYYVRVWTDSSAPVDFKIGFRSLQNFDQVPIANTTTTNSCKPFTTVNVTNSNSRNWISLIDTTSGIVAEINPNGNLLGLTSGSYFINSTGTIRRANGTIPYLDRNIGIKVTNQPTTDVGIRLYFTEQERAAYFAAVGANPLAVTHYAGALCVGSAQAGNSELLPAVINRTANGNYYVEFNTRRFSGFFIGPNNRLVFSNEVNAEKNKLSIDAAYPIPVTTELGVIFTAQHHAQNGKLFITDILGKIVLEQALSIEAGQNDLRLDVSTLSNGLYFLNISDGVRQAAKKIIKQ